MTHTHLGLFLKNPMIFFYSFPTASLWIIKDETLKMLLTHQPVSKKVKEKKRKWEWKKKSPTYQPVSKILLHLPPPRQKGNSLSLHKAKVKGSQTYFLLCLFLNLLPAFCFLIGFCQLDLLLHPRASSADLPSPWPDLKWDWHSDLQQW